jgi:hypothetical protein
MMMNEKDFIKLLDKATYFAAFNMLSPELEFGFEECMKNIKLELKNNGDNYSNEIQEWALKLLLRESIDNYISKSISNVLANISN